jgi:hypothetical protein
MATEEHGRIALSACGIERGKGIPIRVDLHGISKVLHIVDPDFLTSGLKTGRGGGVEKSLEELVGGGFFHGETMR